MAAAGQEAGASVEHPNQDCNFPVFLAVIEPREGARGTNRIALRKCMTLRSL